LPTYEYRCVSCEHQFERFQRMSDDPVKECEVCGEPVKRLLFPVAIQFKGKGFYTTDYARRSSLGAAATNTANGGSSESSADSSASPAGASAPENGGSSGNGKSAASEAGASVPAAASSKND
jgi:putative FmdB family regulatory protein